MTDSLRLYVRYIAISVRAQLQYRASTVMILLGNLLVTGIEFLGMWALFDRFGTLKGWRLEEVALLYGMAALIGFLLLWLTSYDIMFRRMGWTAWKKLHNGVYILLALGLLHLCHFGKPLCWLDWLEGTQTQSCVRGGHIPPLSFILFLGVVLVSVLRLLEPLVRQPKWVNDRDDRDG